MKTLAQLPFQPSARHKRIESPRELGFVECTAAAVLLGPPGVGKTHLAIILAVAAVVLGDEVMAAALLDRLPRHSHIVNISGNRYRLREHEELLRAGSADAEDRPGPATCFLPGRPTALSPRGTHPLPAAFGERVRVQQGHCSRADGLRSLSKARIDTAERVAQPGSRRFEHPGGFRRAESTL